MWLVGTGRVVPNMEGIKQDTPKALRRLLDSCINYEREQRPDFKHVLAEVERIMHSIPKISRSNSEPILHRTTFSTDVDDEDDTSIPKTPAALI